MPLIKMVLLRWFVQLIYLVAIVERCLSLELARASEGSTVTEGEPLKLYCESTEPWQYCYWQQGDGDALRTFEGKKYMQTVLDSLWNFMAGSEQVAAWVWLFKHFYDWQWGSSDLIHGFFAWNIEQISFLTGSGLMASAF